jgi:hypothetical protein
MKVIIFSPISFEYPCIPKSGGNVQGIVKS